MGWKEPCLATSAALHIKGRLLAALLLAKIDLVEEAKAPLVLESTGVGVILDALGMLRASFNLQQEGIICLFLPLG